MPYFTSCQSEYEHNNYDALYNLLERLREAFLKERAAIEMMNEEELRECGSMISGLFGEMTCYMGRVDKLPQAELKQAAEMLRETRLIRDENNVLLKKALKRTGAAIKNNCTGLQAAKSYHKQEPVKDLFIKKNC